MFITGDLVKVKRREWYSYGDLAIIITPDVFGDGCGYYESKILTGLNEGKLIIYSDRVLCLVIKHFDLFKDDVCLT